MGLSRRLAYKRNDTMFGVTIFLLGVAAANYYAFFDILAPGISNGSGSVKSSMGIYFLIPIVVLTVVQALYVSGLLHLVTRAFYAEKRDFVKALFVSSVEVLLYSVYYTIYPSWGPYLIIVGTFRGTSAASYLVLLGWTAVIVGVIAIVINGVYGFKKGEIRRSILVLLSAALLGLVLALAD